MSRVYTEKVIEDVCIGTAAYIWQFYKALGSTRIDFEAPPTFGGSLLDFFLNVFGSSDPYIAEEVEITESWSQFDVWHNVDTRLHLIPLRFKADWPPPQQWAKQIDWGALSQNNPRFRRKCVNIRTRKAGASSGE